MSAKLRFVSFASGSSGNCSLLSGPGGHILIDAGISMKRIRENLALYSLSPGELSGILITHEHSDHTAGLKMLCKYYNIPVYAPAVVASCLRRGLAGLPARVDVIPVGECFSLAGMEIKAFHTPHDSEESVGYRFDCGTVFAFATDMGHVSPEVLEGLSGADAVFIEANHDPGMLRGGPYPAYLKRRILSENGHLSNGDCAVLARELAERGTRCMILGHLSRENNRPELALSAVRQALEGSGATVCAAPAARSICIEFERDSLCLQ